MVCKFAKYAWPAVLVALLPISCFAQNKPVITPTVPATDWRLVNSQALPLSAVGRFGGDTAVEKEYGVKSLELRTYKLEKEQAQALVEAAPDATAAYGLMTFYQTPTMTPENEIQLAVGDGHQSLMARGGNFIRFLRSAGSPLSDADYHALLIFVGGSKPSESVLRSLPSPMPPQGLIPGTEKYLLGLEAAKRVLPTFRTDLIGFDQDAEVQLGQYKTVKGTATVISISYPTPQMARIRFGSLKDLLNLNQVRGDGSAFGDRHGSYVFLVLNAGDQATATGLLDQFQVSQGLSWDQKYTSERSFTLQLVHMILAIFLLTAFLVAACVIVGVLFFLSRRLAAKFFPDSQWGRTDEDQLIRLNIKY
jgi:hypothetical protein